MQFAAGKSNIYAILTKCVLTWELFPDTESEWHTQTHTHTHTRIL